MGVNNSAKRILYISFLGMLEPVAYSQVYSYILGLSRENNLRFFLLSFEKESLRRQTDYLRIEDLSLQLKQHNVQWHILRHRRGWGKFINLGECFFYAAFLILKNRIDIIHSRASDAAMVGFLLAKSFGLKFVYDRRGMMAEDYSDDATTNFKFRRGGFIYRLINRLDQLVMLGSDKIVVLTQRIFEVIVKEEHFAQRSGRFQVIPCCVNLSAYPRFEKNGSALLSELGLRDKFIINYTGSLTKIHKLTEMVDFFKSAKGKLPRAHFLFLTLTDRDLLAAELKGRGLNQGDFTIIAASPLRINEYLAICDFALMFFKPTFIRLAASPTKLAECLASGLPILINKHIGDTQDLLEKNRVGIVVDGFSQAGYQEALERMLRLLSEPDLRLRCRQTAEDNFSLQLGVERYRRVYSEL